MGGDVRIFVVNESGSGKKEAVEKRSAISPASAKKLINLGCELLLESGTGLASGYDDTQYEGENIKFVSRKEGLTEADIILYVSRPSENDLASIKKGAIVVGHLDPFFQKPLIEKIASHGITSLSIEMIPRSTRAQKMDALSSQASLAGYVMVMEAANALPSIFPMMMTPSGTIKPAKVFVIGAGVAGLQAIATAKRLGANVLAYDTRPVVAEQVESLGGKFLKIDIGETGQTKDGYAKALTEEQQTIQKEAQKQAIADSDIVITTAQLFGRKPPVLITKDTLSLMKPGSVVVDMAVMSGGNVEGSKPGEVLTVEGVTIIGTGNWSQRVAKDATDMYANNCLNLIDEFFDAETKSFNLNLEDDILAQSIITYDGKVCNEMLATHYEGEK